MSARIDERNRLELEFAGPRINLLAGGAAIGALQSITYLGLMHSKLALLKNSRAFDALEKPTEDQKRDFKIEKLMHELTAGPARAAVDSAAIIYAHAILDAVIYKLCSMSISQDPIAWRPFIRDRKVSFSDLQQNNSLNIVQKRLLENYLGQLERESLLFKCDILFKVIKPKHTRGVLPGFKYSRDRLAVLDTLRHDLVHKQGFHRHARHSKAKVDYLLSTGEFFINLLLNHYRTVRAANGQ